ncbi:glycosyltransferase [Micromonospora auratinigra]|uniref:Glycosyltransferase involved in cell wall bisynthesis n=1 Tax=Micromonospora auratinigra TaxID=261654 RepID=A0A1A8Z1L4_9ACTN|nr:glycosyltransferase [Micromonospora auratinigra]SBT37700.1 Glycosyltransferase involved in cell wall bisynthesis [Micromonospora auratinigra]
MRHKTFVSVVLYCRDETPTLETFLDRVGPWLAEHFELHELVVVDDNSAQDPTPTVTACARRHRLNAAVIRLARRHGVEAGIKAGLDQAMGDWVFEVESPVTDFPLDVLGRMYEVATVDGCDVVTAAGDEGSLRSRIFYRLVNRYSDLDIPLRTERLRLTSRRTLTAMLAMREKVRYRKALYAVLGHRHEHLRYTPTGSGRAVPQRRLDRETTSLAFDILLSFSGFGLRLAHRLSLAFGALSLAGIGYAVTVFLVKSDLVQGWTTLAILVSGGLTGLFLILGVLGEYLARILIEVRARPTYSVRDRVVCQAAELPGQAAGPPGPYLHAQITGEQPHPAPLGSGR